MFNAIGAILWVCTWVTVGYVSGSHIDTVYATISRYLIYVLIAAALIVLSLLARHLLRRHREEENQGPTPGPG